MNMNKYVKLGIFTIIVSAAFVLCAAPESSAKPASPFPFTVELPDGTTLELYKRGDEFRNWTESADGYTVLENNEGYWEFAESKDGKLVSTGVIYRPGTTPPFGVEKHEKPEVSAKFHKVISERAASGVWTPRPIEGARQVLLILVGFERTNFTTDIDQHWQQVFGATDSVVQYYRDQSRDKLIIVPVVDMVVNVKLESDHPGDSIAGNDDAAYEAEVKFVTEALGAALDVADLSLKSFDTDNDGEVTPDELCVYMILAGYEKSGTDKEPNVHAHAFSSDLDRGDPYVVRVGDVVLTDWAMHGELHDDDKPEQMGTPAHELGHQLCRLPDLYDVSYANQGLGSFSLMDGGCNGTITGGIPGSRAVNLDAWSRQYLGWEEPNQPANGPVTFTTPKLGNGKSSVKLLNGGYSATEYFLVEVRDFSSWDKGLEGLFQENTNFEGGLLIMHVDEAIGSGSIELGNDINDASKNLHQGVMAVDAQYPRDRGKPSTPFTLWWGDNPEIRGSARPQSDTTAKTVNLVNFTRPDSNFYGNVASGISITGIGNFEDGKLAATVMAPQTEFFSQSENSLGCNSTGVIVPALALIVCGIYLAGLTRRRGRGPSRH